MQKLFGTDGVRGRAGDPPLDPATVYRLGRALAESGRTKVLIGRDTRHSGVWIEQALREGILSAGGSVRLAGVITTPGVAFLTGSGPFDCGAVISASHNPARDNGIKVFSSAGTKLGDPEEAALEQAVASQQGAGSVASDSSVDPAQLTRFDAELMQRYLEHLKAGCRSSLSGLKIVLDCAQGAAFHIAPRAFAELGAEVEPVGDLPDGRNINVDCGSLYPQTLVRRVRESGACFGVAFDGDSDRAIFCDGAGRLLDGDHILFILARHLRDRGGLESGVVVTTVMANLGLEAALRRENLRLLRTRVGDRYVWEQMVEGGHELGGEQSGHIILRRHTTTGDGVLTALKIAEIVAGGELTLDALGAGLTKFPQVIRNVPVQRKPGFEQIPEIGQALARAEGKLGEEGRVLVRYSGTEPLVRVMLEGKDEALIAALADGLAALFEERLGHRS